jgi:hypothetical protein
MTIFWFITIFSCFWGFMWVTAKIIWHLAYIAGKMGDIEISLSRIASIEADRYRKELDDMDNQRRK